jgi:plastocyanin
MTIVRTALPLTCALALALALAGCGSRSSPPASSAPAPARSGTAGTSTIAPGAARAGTMHVAIAGYAFHPGTVTVTRGAKVIFSNRDKTNHTATANAGAFDTGTLAPGATRTVTLSHTGTYTYFCQFHAFMKATLVVR